MEIPEEQHKWRQLQYDLVAVSESLREHVSAGNRFLVWDYVDHNEFGLAFDHLLDAAFDEPDHPPPLSDEQAQVLLTLGKAIGYPSDSDRCFKLFLAKYFPDELSSR
ncbi:hypothetical protein [Deinococcus radiopugnans]|uniref:hypothetical protein n=1 Tax=Deinococcus radiopugnans TaxID=57497 RepID=UPI0014702606|nr:hypothetical protein [Deinococcus radiopugnans]